VFTGSCQKEVVARIRLVSLPSGQVIAISSAADLLDSSSEFIDIDIFVNCNWVDTRWQ
jgi:hypothetical protein